MLFVKLSSIDLSLEIPEIRINCLINRKKLPSKEDENNNKGKYYHKELLFIALYYRHLSADIEMKLIRLLLQTNR